MNVFEPCLVGVVMVAIAVVGAVFVPEWIRWGKD